MKSRIILTLLLLNGLLTGCASLTNMTAFDGLSGIPTMTEPDLDDE